MLRKSGAHFKDKLKQHLHHHGPHGSSSSSSGSKARSHRSRSNPHRHQTPQAMSFSAMDNEAFEQILNDDTDLSFHIKPPSRPPPPAAPQRGLNIPNDPLAIDDESDLFDADMFVVGEEEIPKAGDDESGDSDPLSSSPAINCDPLSGQIVSQSIPTGGMGIQNETETDKEIVSSKDSELDNSDSQDDELFPNDEIAREDVEEEGGKKRSLSHPLAPPTEITSEHIVGREHSGIPPRLVSAVDSTPLSSSLPSHLETAITSPLQVAPNSNPLPRKNLSGGSSESFPSDIESELEQLLAPRKPSPLKPRDGIVPSNTSAGGGGHHQLQVSQRGVSSEREGSHLDSGVFENEGREFDSCTPEDREREKTSGKEDGKLFPIHDDHFKASSVSMETTQAGLTSDVVSKNSEKRSPKAARGNSPVIKRNSAGKIPPPRPPLSPQVQRKMKSAPTIVRPHSSQSMLSDHVTSDEVVPKMVQPLGAADTAGGVAGGGAKHAEQLLDDDDDDDLFPNDAKKIRELEENMALAMRESDNSPVPPAMPPRPRLENSTPSPHPHSSSYPLPPATPPRLTPSPRPHAATITTSTAEAEADKTTTTEEKVSSVSTTTTSSDQQLKSEGADLSPSLHLLLSLFLYLYYSLNIFPYLAGLFAGFLMLYVFLGSVFVYYVHSIEKEREERREQKRKVSVSDDFVQSMKVDFNKIKEYQVKLSCCILA